MVAEFRDSDGTNFGLVPGLSGTGEFARKLTSRQESQEPIRRLRPGTELHDKVLNYVTDRIKFSERRMSQFYSRWNYNERRTQAYIDLPAYERALKDLNNQGQPASAISMVIPYSYATIQTIITYNIHTFAGRKPMFPIGSYGSADVGSKRAMAMENWLQFNADQSNFLRELYQFLQDQEVYGVGALRTDWKVMEKMRTVWISQAAPPPSFMGMQIGAAEQGPQKKREMRTVYAGNEAKAIDPFMFFPDPRVPMHRVAEDGEFVFWRSYEGKHNLLGLQAQGAISWVDNIPGQPRTLGESSVSVSDRALRATGQGVAGEMFAESQSYGGAAFVQVDQGTVELIPRELGLGNSTVPEKWLFSIGNMGQILQAMPYSRDHDNHPVAVAEPYTFGYSFGSLGLSDYLGPLQDTISWFVNSHIHNVRSVLNNMLVVDPAKVEMQDLNRPGPGKVIRLKSYAFGTDVREAISQLQVGDVTGRHVEDLQLFVRFADAIAAVSDNIRGINSSGGRKTATEVRTSGEAAASRLAAHAKIISGQALSPLAGMWTMNTQQFLDQEIWFAVTGMDGSKLPNTIHPEQITGEYYFPVHDGTLPIDRIAMLDVWREIFSTIVQAPELAQRYDVAGIFTHIAELGGAPDLKRFAIDVRPNEVLEQQAQAGNVVPISQAGDIPGSQVNNNRPGTVDRRQLRGGQ